MKKRAVEIHSAHKRLVLPRREVRALLACLDQWTLYTLPRGSLSIAFLTEEGITELHGRFLEDPTPTDVITFPGDPAIDFAGEICVCVDRAYTEAIHHRNSFADELILYLVHGWLHLAGEDDTTKAATAQMRLAEQKAIDYLKAAHIWPAFDIKPARL